VRQLRNGLNHTYGERPAIQMTLVSGFPTWTRQFRPRRFVYCSCRIFDLGSRLMARGPHSDQKHSRVSELHR